MDPEIRKLELQLELERTRVQVDFARFGFRGTLAGGIICVTAILALACLKAFAHLAISDSALVGLAVLFVAATVAFGYFSLWRAPNIVARLGKTQLSMRSGTAQSKQTVE